MQSIDKDNIVTKVEPKLRVLTVFFHFITRRAEGDGGLKIAYSVFSAKTRQERKSGSEIEREGRSEENRKGTIQSWPEGSEATLSEGGSTIGDRLVSLFTAPPPLCPLLDKL